MSKSIIIIPAYKEEDRIVKTLKNYLSFEGDILVVINCPQNTLKVVKDFKNRYDKKNKIKIISFSKGVGKGLAIYYGLYYALLKNYEYYILADADLAANIKEINKILTFLREEYDLVIGNRIKGSLLEGHSFLRKIFSRFCVIYFNILFFDNFRYFEDVQTGYLGLSKKLAKLFLKKFHKKSMKYFSYNGYILYLANKYRLKIIEIPIKWKNDSDTKSINIRTPFRIAIDYIKIRLYTLGKK